MSWERVALLALMSASLISLPAALATAKDCGCKVLNAQSAAPGGTCRVAEDSSSLCRMEWNDTETAHADQDNASTSSSSNSQSRGQVASQNQSRRTELSKTGGRDLEAQVNRMLESKSGFNKDTFGLAYRLLPTRSVNISPVGSASEVVNAYLGGKYPDIASWAVIYLAAFAYAPFVRSNDDVQRLVDVLADYHQQWIRDFLVAPRDGATSAYERNGFRITASADCLEVQAPDRIRIMINGPRSPFIRQCAQ